MQILNLNLQPEYKTQRKELFMKFINDIRICVKEYRYRQYKQLIKQCIDWSFLKAFYLSHTLTVGISSRDDTNCLKPRNLEARFIHTKFMDNVLQNQL